MHAVGLHSALAIKRQRKRRDEQKRARERRYSTQSTDSGLTSPHQSMGSLADGGRAGARRRVARGAAASDDVGSKVVTSIGMLHIGVVFLVLGAFLLASGLLPGDLANLGGAAPTSWFNELVVTGAFAFAIGIFLIVINRIISKKEEDDLNEYVQRQLTRSRSGHRLIRDVETGNLTTKHAAARGRGDGPAPVHGAGSPDGSDGPISPDAALSLPMPLSPLEPVLEEREAEKGEDESRGSDLAFKEAMSNGSTTGGSLSPGSPSETQGLLRTHGTVLRI